MDIILVIPAVALCAQFNLPYTHIAFILYYSIIFVLNIFVLCEYFANVAFENIKEYNGNYNDNYNMNDVIDVITERMN